MSQIQDNIPDAFERLMKAVSEWTREGIDLIDERMKESMNEPKTGAVNPRTGKNRSAPGESPGVDRGDLLKSLSRDYQFLKSVEYSRDPKAEYLETGTSKMDARPLWGKTLEELKSELENSLEQKVKEAEGR